MTIEITRETARAILDYFPENDDEMPAAVNSFFDELLGAIDEAQGNHTEEDEDLRSFTVVVSYTDQPKAT